MTCRQTMLFLLSLFALPCSVACERRIVEPSSARIAESSIPIAAAASVSAAPIASIRSAPPQPKPLRATAGIVDLEVSGYPAAVVSLPLGATSRRPIVVAAHGNYDRPEWQCGVWRDLVGDNAFVFCPRGVARPDSPSPDDVRFTYETNAALERELDAGLEALAKAYPDYVDPERLVYTGFSLGAIMGVTMAGRKPARARRFVLVEGGHAAWKPDVVKAFAAGGEARVLFVCSQAGCEKDAQWAASRLRKADVLTRILKTKDVGHRYDGPVADAIRNVLPWVFEGDARFE